MKYSNIYKSVSKATCSALLSAGVLTASFSAQAAVENLQPTQSPLSLTKGVPPNVLITLDDSGSMDADYAPDAINYSGYRAMRSNMYNSMYYNPDVIYVIPKKYSLSGTAVVGEDKYTTSFTSAKSDGFLEESGIDLTSVAFYYRYDPDLSCPSSPQRSRGDAPHCWNTRTERKCTPWWSGNCQDITSYSYISPAYDCPTGKAVNKEGCYAKENITADKQQNFANWYSFYRTRKLATQSAAILAFASMPDNVRLTWGALNSCNIGKNINKETNYINSRYHDAWCYNNKIERFSGQHRVNFFDWVGKLTVNGGTPLHAALHRAGEFLKADTDDSVCRASYHVLMTDGMWNDRSTNHKNDADSTAATLPDGTAYTPRAPFHDGRKVAWSSDDTRYTSSFSTNRTLADSAFYYWANDLKGIDNKVVPYMPIDTGNPAKDYWDPRNNPATWQHMVNFTVGLGLSNSLTNPDAPTWYGDKESPTYADMDELFKIGASGKNWPLVRDDHSHLGSARSSPNNVYDLWHAAINSRGEFFSADSPDSLVEAFEKILERISGRKTTASSPAINSGVGDDGTGYAFQASYEADKSWAGNLTAIKKGVDKDGNLTMSSAWPLGDASAQLTSKAYASRAIKMAGGSGLVDFQWSNLSDEQKGYLNRDPDVKNNKDKLGNSRLDFLRGDRSKEGSSFRKRSSVLGDIINSKPITVRGARYLAGHANRIEGAASKYEDFVTAQKGTTDKPRTPMVYVGANDGMLHGFNADTGEETFAFVPTAVFPELNQLTATGYGEAKHRFFVDGSPVVADVFINDKWRTVLVGTLGAGGKGMFALDVTDPTDIQLLWEFNEDKLMDKLGKDGKVETKGAVVKLGYTFSQPTIARLHNGKWAAVVGNGYAAADSVNGKASLLIIDMATGGLTKELVVQGADKVPNGMSTPKLADINADGIADYAYAGDLQGNLWRFDLAPDNGDENNPFLREGDPRTSENFDGFQVSFGGSPLFVSKDTKDVRQPITAPPSIVRHPTGTGYIIVVGTGRYFVDTDKEGLSNASQTIYGIWDRTTKVARSGTVPTIANRSNLLEQKMESVTTAVDNGKKARVLSDYTVDWTKQNGWYFDLVLNKEMIVADMLQFGQTLYFQTLLPNADPCATGVDNWSYAINPSTGGRTLHHAWTDYRNTDSPNVPITAVKMDGEGGLSIGQRPDKKFELCTGVECKEITPDPASIGRQSWRMVPDA